MPEMDSTLDDSKFLIDSWLPNFHHLVPSTRLIPLSRDFCDLLVEDGVFVPKSGQDEEEDDSSESQSSSSDDGYRASQRSFPELERAINEAIKVLGGAVVPKVGSRTPIDAEWMNFNEAMKCTNFSDVFLLLKSSDRCAEDVHDRLRHGKDVVLSLKRWVNVHPGMEFRVFIRNERVLAICQRERQHRFEHLHERRSAIQSLLVAFYENKIKGRFSEADLVLDVYVDRKDTVWIVDLAAFGEPTDSLLYSWEELGENSEKMPVDFRILDRDRNAPADCMYHGIPYELQGEHGRQALAEAAQIIVDRANQASEN